jgi:methionyl-tRNA formyltransferase
MHKIIFFGTSLISAKILQYLLTDKEVEVLAVVCQPDQKKIPETKKVALQNNLKFYQPEKLKTIFEELKGLQSDLILTCSYGKIIPRIYLNMPKYKCINIHTSLLPKLRGPNPIRYAILQNEKKTGVTLMYMEEGLDTGNIIFQQEVEITSKETYSTLYEKLSEASIQILKQHLHSLFSDNVISYKQIEENATFCEKLTREKEKID